MRIDRLFIAGLGCALVATGNSSLARNYDPLRLAKGSEPTIVELTCHDATRQRDIPLRVYLPGEKRGAPVVLFSHGLGGSRAGSVFLGQHWAARGYAAVFLQHHGSDSRVWEDVPSEDRMEALKKAASVQNLILRLRDVPAVLDQLKVWNEDPGNALTHRLDLSKVGMSGHSFGALTTEGVSGEMLPAARQEMTDPRIKAAVIFSPSAPRTESAETAFGSVKIPWMLMTGTRDASPISDLDAAARLRVYAALRGAPKFQVVLYNAEHSVFTDHSLPGEHEAHNPNHHRVILALSTAFWDAYLRGDAAALAWLKGPGPRSIMEGRDQWEFQAP